MFLWAKQTLRYWGKQNDDTSPAAVLLSTYGTVSYHRCALPSLMVPLAFVGIENWVDRVDDKLYLSTEAL